MTLRAPRSAPPPVPVLKEAYTNSTRSLKDALQQIEHWRIVYNPQRPHSSLDNLTPSEFAMKSQTNPISRCRKSDRRLSTKISSHCSELATQPGSSDSPLCLSRCGPQIIYTTNAIESLNASVRKAVRNKGHFPSDQAASGEARQATRSRALLDGTVFGGPAASLPVREDEPSVISILQSEGSTDRASSACARVRAGTRSIRVSSDFHDAAA